MSKIHTITMPGRSLLDHPLILDEFSLDPSRSINHLRGITLSNKFQSQVVIINPQNESMIQTKSRHYDVNINLFTFENRIIRVDMLAFQM